MYSTFASLPANPKKWGYRSRGRRYKAGLREEKERREERKREGYWSRGRRWRGGDLQDKLSVYMYIKCLNKESLCLGTIYYSLLDKPSVI